MSSFQPSGERRRRLQLLRQPSHARHVLRLLQEAPRHLRRRFRRLRRRHGGRTGGARRQHLFCTCWRRINTALVRGAQGGEGAAAAKPVRGVLQEGGADGVHVRMREDLLREAPLHGEARLRLRLQGRRPPHHRPSQPPDQGREAGRQNLIDRRG